MSLTAGRNMGPPRARLMPLLISTLTHPPSGVGRPARDELGAVVATDQLRRPAALLDDLFEDADGLVGTHPPRGWRCERLAGVFVGDGQDLQRPPVGGAVTDEVDRPALVGRRC